MLHNYWKYYTFMNFHSSLWAMVLLCCDSENEKTSRLLFVMKVINFHVYDCAFVRMSCLSKCAK